MPKRRLAARESWKEPRIHLFTQVNANYVSEYLKAIESGGKHGVIHVCSANSYYLGRRHTGDWYIHDVVIHL